MTSTPNPPEIDPAAEFPRDREPGRVARLASRFGGFVKRHWKWIVPSTAAVIAGLAWLAFGYFGIHTLFIDDVVDEDGPVFASGAVAETEDPADGTASTPEATPTPTPAATEAATPEPDDGDGSEAAATPTPEATPEPTPEPAVETTPEIVTLFEGSFTGLGRYSVEGEVVVLNDGTEQRFLRFPDLNADNGPDLNVYLSAAPADGPSGDLDDDFIDLGDLKGNIGSQNYEIPPDVDLERYSTVVIWCVRFSAGFGVAALSPPAA